MRFAMSSFDAGFDGVSVAKLARYVRRATDVSDNRR